MIYSEKKIKKSGKIKKTVFQFNVKDVPFSKKLSYLYIDEGLGVTETAPRRNSFV